jgi:hypothetical protein
MQRAEGEGFFELGGHGWLSFRNSKHPIHTL